eukprot:PhM_4_TR14225/c1_g1_i1/m.66629
MDEYIRFVHNDTVFYVLNGNDNEIWCEHVDKESNTTVFVHQVTGERRNHLPSSQPFGLKDDYDVNKDDKFTTKDTGNEETGGSEGEESLEETLSTDQDESISAVPMKKAPSPPTASLSVVSHTRTSSPDSNNANHQNITTEESPHRYSQRLIQLQHEMGSLLSAAAELRLDRRDNDSSSVHSPPSLATRDEALDKLMKSWECDEVERQQRHLRRIERERQFGELLTSAPVSVGAPITTEKDLSPDRQQLMHQLRATSEITSTLRSELESLMAERLAHQKSIAQLQRSLTDRERELAIIVDEQRKTGMENRSLMERNAVLRNKVSAAHFELRELQAERDDVVARYDFVQKENTHLRSALQSALAVKSLEEYSSPPRPKDAQTGDTHKGQGEAERQNDNDEDKHDDNLKEGLPTTNENGSTTKSVSVLESIKARLARLDLPLQTSRSYNSSGSPRRDINNTSNVYIKQPQRGGSSSSAHGSPYGSPRRSALSPSSQQKRQAQQFCDASTDALIITPTRPQKSTAVATEEKKYQNKLIETENIPSPEKEQFRADNARMASMLVDLRQELDRWKFIAEGCNHNGQLSEHGVPVPTTTMMMMPTTIPLPLPTTSSASARFPPRPASPAPPHPTPVIDRAQLKLQQNPPSSSPRHVYSGWPLTPISSGAAVTDNLTSSAVAAMHFLSPSQSRGVPR